MNVAGQRRARAEEHALPYLVVVLNRGPGIDHNTIGNARIHIHERECTHKDVAAQHSARADHRGRMDQIHQRWRTLSTKSRLGLRVLQCNE